MQDLTYGMIGLGAMGLPMACHLIEAGYTICGYDPREERVRQLVEAGGEAAGDAAAIVATSDVVMTSLVSNVYKDVAENVLLPNCRAGQVMIDFGTNPAPHTRKMAATFEAKGVVALDVPVSGGEGGAQRGDLMVFIGGDKATVDRFMPVFTVIGEPSRTVYGGRAGQGQVLKVVQQLKNRLLDAARMEIIAFGLRDGLDIQQVLGALDLTIDSDDPYANIARNIEAGNTDHMSCLFGEWAYYLEEARDQGIPMPMLESLYRFCEAGERVNKDGQGRPGPSVFNELMRQTGPTLSP